MKSHIHNHFRQVDPVLFAALQNIEEPLDITASGNLYADLCDAIISQQLSTKVSAVLVERVKVILEGDWSPQRLLLLSDERIREQGISYAKIASLKDLSNKMVRKEINLNSLKSLPGEEVISNLVTVKGIGPWTAQMFLMFSLGREDVFSPGDGGLRRAIKILYGLRSEPTLQEMEKMSAPWSPYRTYASRILWKSLDTKQ